MQTLEFWKHSYFEKKELLDSRFQEVCARDFYRDLFPEGSLEKKGDLSSTGKGNIIASSIKKDERNGTKSWIVTDDLEDLCHVEGVEFGLIAPVSWFGKTHRKINAHELFAFAIDIDYVDWQRLKNLLKQFVENIQPTPNYLVSSGKGVHLYYFLEKPIPLYHNLEKMLSQLKKDLIRRIWTDTVSLKPDNPDITGIFQGFRCVGCLSKLGEGFPVRAWKLSDARFTLEKLQSYCPYSTVDVSILHTKPEWKPKPLRIPLEECRTLFPDWYNRKILRQQSKPVIWHNDARLYEWWKRKILKEAKTGGRYFALIALCAFGRKCGIDDDVIKKDAWSFLEHLERLTDDETNHFTDTDIKDALESLSNPELALTTRQWLSDHSKIAITPNKRNGRTRSENLQIARFIRDFNQNKNGTKWNGRKSAQQTFERYYLYIDGANCKEFCEKTGLKKSVWYKYKKIYDERMNGPASKTPQK